MNSSLEGGGLSLYHRSKHSSVRKSSNFYPRVIYDRRRSHRARNVFTSQLPWPKPGPVFSKSSFSSLAKPSFFIARGYKDALVPNIALFSPSLSQLRSKLKVGQQKMGFLSLRFFLSPSTLFRRMKPSPDGKKAPQGAALKKKESERVKKC